MITIEKNLRELLEEDKKVLRISLSTELIQMESEEQISNQQTVEKPFFIFQS